MPSMHTHYYNGETSFNDGHRHSYSGQTSPSPDVPGHTHQLYGRTAIADRHTHEFAFTSGPERDINGGHVHYYRGIAEFNDGHEHTMGGYTSVD